MHLKSFIIGLFLFSIGGGTLWWIDSERQKQEHEAHALKERYGSETTEYIKQYENWVNLPPDERNVLPSGLDLKANKTSEEIIQEQEERLKADMDKLAAGEMTVYPFADDFYGMNWKDKVEQYKKEQEQREFLFNISIGSTASGGLLAGWVILLQIARLIIKIISKLKNSISSKSKEKGIEDIDTESKENDSILDGNEGSHENEHFKDISNVLVNSGWQYAGNFNGEQKTRLRQRKRIPAKNRAISEEKNMDNPQENVEVKSEVKSGEKIEETQQSTVENDKKVSGDKTQSEAIIKNHNVEITNPKGHSHQIDTTLKDLTQQVSAIREYAANQQNRLERLQDGYDWNIIKTFCLRIIRCIDNVEKRIEQVEQEDVQAIHLEDIRDELVFALESSGIEQFEPKVNTYYRGQEKIAEAVKEKAHSKDPNKKGKIEKVIKPGYQFYIDDENVKIVRPAQVRIFA